MLVISPGERITVEEMMHHPWLNNGSAPNTVLQSPQQMLDQVHLILSVIKSVAFSLVKSLVYFFARNRSAMYVDIVSGILRQ